MVWEMPLYLEPDFRQARFQAAPDVKLVPAPKKGVAPDNYHAMSIFPEYFKVEGKWLLAADSRMDCVAVYKQQKIQVVEFRNLHQGDLVVVGRTEQGEKGIFVHSRAFAVEEESQDVFAFRQGRSRETSYSVITIPSMRCWNMNRNTVRLSGSWGRPVLLMLVHGRLLPNWSGTVLWTD
jgi:hypothetical protein